MFASKRKAIGAAVAAATVTAGLAVNLPSSSASGGCEGQNQSLATSAFGDTTQYVASNSGPSSLEFGIATIPAGTYRITLGSYEGHPNRPNDVEPSEIWYAEIIGNSGVLATTGTTSDLADGVEEASGVYNVGEVTLGADATTVRAVHGAPGAAETNSVHPVCIGFTLVEAEVEPQLPEEPDVPTVEPEAPTVEPEQPVVNPEQPEVAPPVVTDVTPTPAATPTPSQPRFTG